MKVIALMNTGNDADIIELSIRHNLKHLSKIIVLDNNSQDGTREIIDTLIEEFPNRINIMYTDSRTTTEHMYTTNFAKQKILDFDDPDYLIVLDADEFIKADDLSELKTIPENHVGLIKWKCYIPNRLDHKNFPEEMQYRRDREPDGCHKVIMPRGVEGHLILGNHYLHQGEDSHRAPCYELKTISLAHYPVRSIEQINKKIDFISKFFKYENPTQSYHLRNTKHLETLEELVKKALQYSSLNKEKFELVYDPL